MTTVSSKGQIVIPKKAREALGLQAGTRLNVESQADKIILEPIVLSPIDALYGKYADFDLLSELETEHRQEIDAHAFAAIAAHELNAILVTGDPELLALQNSIRIERLTRTRK